MKIVAEMAIFRLLSHLKGYEIQKTQIGHFAVECLVSWPWIESEAGVDLVLIETSLLFVYKCKLVSIRTA